MFEEVSNSMLNKRSHQTDRSSKRSRETEQGITKENNQNTKTNYIKEIRTMVIYIFMTVAIVFFIYNFVGQRVEVSGISMENTLEDNDQLILEKISYRFQEPKRFDIIVFTPHAGNDDIYYIKRIIGLPGETVQIIGSDIYINDIKLEESFGKELITDGGIAKQKITLDEDEYFVMGDNRNNSKDSRFTEVGNVDKDAIMGRAFFRIWPYRSMGLLKHQ